MILPLLARIGFIAIAAVIALLVYRVKRGKDGSVRETYILKAITLLISLAVSAVGCMSSRYSLWDVLALWLGADTQEPVWLTLLSRTFTMVVFLVCCIAVLRLYKNWSGPVSRRQFQMNTQKMEDGHILSDLYAALAALFKENYDLKPHQDPPRSAGLDEESVEDLPWHMEFAKIYSLMSNQARIEVKEDWHALQHCFISSYAGNQKIAVYCAVVMPSDQEIDAFWAYIHRLHPNYFKIIVAVKEGARADQPARRGQAIEYIFKDEALDSLVDFSEYFRAIDAQYNKPLMENADVRLEDIYVDLDFRKGAGGDALPLSPYVERWLQQEELRQLALLGDFGQGKSMFSLRLTHQLIHARGGRIPILIPLRNKSPRNSSPIEILSYFAAQYGIAPEALAILNANGRLLLIFDGFDEMDLVGSDDIRKRHFQSLWKLVLPRSKVLLTGRPNYFWKPDEMASALGFYPDSGSAPYCEGLILQPFRPEQISLALRSAKASVRTGIQHILDTRLSASFLDLISRPSHLFLVSQIWETRQLEKKYRNLTSAVIINEFLQDCFARQAAKGVRDPYFYLSSVEREYFMVGIAAWMYKAGVTAISYDLFANVIADLLDMFPEKLGARNPAFMNLRGGKSVQEFAREDEHCFTAIMNDVRTCGVLVNDVGNSGLCFAHKSFYDVLAAKFFLGKNMRLHNDASTISDALSKSSAYHPRLKNDVVVRKLLAELISAEIKLRMDGSGDEEKCRKIFEQCRKTIAFWGAGRSPQGLLRRCLRENQGPGQSRRDGPRRHQEQTARLLMIYLVTVICCIGFLVQGARFGRDYREAAGEYYQTLSLPNSSVEPEIDGMSRIWILAETVGISVLVFLLTSVRLRSSRWDKGELILLTWYYACKENQIAEEVILQQFSPKYTAAFTAYIQGRSLTEIQNRLERSRSQSDKQKNQMD